jgi:CheY-like chemotaxis protein
LEGTRWLAGAKILVVDDSDINLEVIQHILRRQGAIVAICSTGVEALERLRLDPNAFEIVLMDVQMPDMDGHEAARRIRTDLKLETLPIIALTAGALLSERERSLQAGMSDFVTKPFEPAALIGIVRRYLKPTPGTSSQIDATVAQDVVGDDTARFLSLVSHLVRDLGEFGLRLGADLHDPRSRSQLTFRLHAFKGSAGLIGATHIHRLAGAAEAAIAGGKAPEMIDPLLRQLTDALSALGYELAPMLAATSTTNPALTGEFAAAIVATTVSFDRLLELLNAQNMDALEHLSAMSPSLSARLGRASFAHLQEAANGLDFAMAAEILRKVPEAKGSLATGPAKRLPH